MNPIHNTDNVPRATTDVNKTQKAVAVEIEVGDSTADNDEIDNSDPLNTIEYSQEGKAKESEFYDEKTELL